MADKKGYFPQEVSLFLLVKLFFCKKSINPGLSVIGLFAVLTDQEQQHACDQHTDDDQGQQEPGRSFFLYIFGKRRFFVADGFFLSGAFGSRFGILLYGRLGFCGAAVV